MTKTALANAIKKCTVMVVKFWKCVSWTGRAHPVTFFQGQSEACITASAWLSMLATQWVLKQYPGPLLGSPRTILVGRPLWECPVWWKLMFQRGLIISTWCTWSNQLATWDRVRIPTFRLLLIASLHFFMLSFGQFQHVLLVLDWGWACTFIPLYCKCIAEQLTLYRDAYFNI